MQKKTRTIEKTVGSRKFRKIIIFEKKKRDIWKIRPHFQNNDNDDSSDNDASDDNDDSNDDDNSDDNDDNDDK